MANTKTADVAVSTRLKTVGGVLACGVLGVGLLVILAVADAEMFEDAEFSRLYKFTLDQAYSRFKASDKQVPARPPADPLDDMMAGGEAVGRSGPQAQIPPGFGQKAQRFRDFGKTGPLGQGLPARGGAGVKPRPQHAHDDGGPHMQKGTEHLRKREYEKAVEEFRLAIRENPSRTLAHHSLGDTLRTLGRHDEAIAAYREVLKLNPAYYCCYTHIGDVEKTRKNLEAAEQAYASAIKGYKSQLAQGGPVAASARYPLAKLYSDGNKNLAEALTLAEQVVKETPDQLMYVQLLAHLYEKVGRAHDAIAMYDKLIQISPAHADYFRMQQQRLRGPVSPTPAP